jgi:ketosteroid isomerase-like protein
MSAGGGILAAMSRENIEVVRTIYDAVGRRDVATPFDLYAEDIVWDLSAWRPAELDPVRVYTGHEGVRKAWRDRLSAWSEVDYEVEELVEAGDRVVAVIRDRQIGRSSGVPIEAAHAAVWTLADGKVTRLQVFDERRQAFEAAGLSAD